MVMSCLNPTRPIESLTTKRHLESCKATETTSLWTLPRVLEVSSVLLSYTPFTVILESQQWCQDPFIIEYLKTLKVLVRILPDSSWLWNLELNNWVFSIPLVLC